MPIVPEHPNRVILPPPHKVSPLIRLTRWSMLSLGIFYGFTRQKYLERRHAAFLEKESEQYLKKRIEDGKKMALTGKESLATVGKEFGMGYSPAWSGYKYEPVDLKKVLK